jgi:septum formation protein
VNLWPGTLILASASPRRADLLAASGITFEIRVPGGVEEHLEGSLPPRDLCLANARLKAHAVSAQEPGRLVLAADTVVTLDGTTLGKPASLAAARRMLEFLAGHTHEVLTGVCLRSADRAIEFIESTKVRFRPARAIDFDAYLARIDPLDKAGAYAAQEDDGTLIEHIEGPFSNVVGLPVERLIGTLHEHFPA